MKIIEIINEGDVIKGNFGKDKKKPEEVKALTGMEAFGSKQLNILHKENINLIEKPFYWEDLDDPNSEIKYKPISEITFKKVKKELAKSGFELKEYSGKEIFGSDTRPKHSQVDAKLPKEIMFVVKFSNFKYLCDTTGARSYIRNWALIK